MMSDSFGQADLASAFQAETDALVTFDRRIAGLIREQRRLEATFTTIASAIDQLLGRGEAPLNLLDELDHVDVEIGHVEQEINEKITVAIARFT